MLAYRHLFHAGNLADVFKHSLLAQMVLAMQRKDKPFVYLDTHAGTGRYDLSHAWAQKNREYENGVAKVLARADCPEGLRPYLDAIRQQNPDGKLRFYPGSPLLVKRLLRSGDRMVLAELNAEDCARLQQHFEGERHVQVRNMDGYQALKAFLPPQERRGLILIDSSFDRANEFRRIEEAFAQAYRRFATGVYAIWYPLMESAATSTLERSIAARGVRKLLKLELSVHPASWRESLRGSAMLVVNPPYQFDKAAAPVLHWLWKVLSIDGAGGYSVRHLADD